MGKLEEWVQVSDEGTIDTYTIVYLSQPIYQFQCPLPLE
jgi:uncharacterized OB-fold protein